MNTIDFVAIAEKLGVSPLLGGIIVVILLAWSLYWKGRALWISARGSHAVWFVVLLLVNTLGILEILYIYVFNKDNKPEVAPEMPITPAV